MRTEYEKAYRALRLPPPLPPAGAPYTELATGCPEGLPVYSPVSSSQDERFEAIRAPGVKCNLCTKTLEFGSTVMCCSHCGVPTHVRCLSDRMLRDAGDVFEVIPSEGFCSVSTCARQLLWSSLVKDVQTYRPRLPPGEQMSVGLGDYGNTATVRGSFGQGPPPVWRVDDSSGEEDDASDGEPEHGAGQDAGCSSDTHSDASQLAEEEEDDDEFWRLGDTLAPKRTAATKTGVGGDEDMAGRQALRGNSVKGKSACSSARPTTDETQIDRSDEGIPVVGIAGHRNYCGGAGESYEELSPPSPPSLPLVERLRLQRLARK